MRLTVKKIFKLSDDYSDIFINKVAKYRVKYEELQLNNRTIHKNYYEDVYILEAHTFYCICFNEEIDSEPSFNSSILESGLLYQFDKTSNKLYVYNCGENVVYIQQGVNLTNE